MNDDFGGGGFSLFGLQIEKLLWLIKHLCFLGTFFLVALSSSPTAAWCSFLIVSADVVNIIAFVVVISVFLL